MICRAIVARMQCVIPRWADSMRLDAVGAVTGVLVGDRISSGSPRHETVQRCRTVSDREQIPVVREPVQVISQPVEFIDEPVQFNRQRLPDEERVYDIEPEEHSYNERHWKHDRHERDDAESYDD